LAFAFAFAFAFALAFAFAFLSVIPSGNLLLLFDKALAPEIGPGFSPDTESRKNPGL